MCETGGSFIAPIPIAPKPHKPYTLSAHRTATVELLRAQASHAFEALDTNHTVTRLASIV